MKGLIAVIYNLVIEDKEFHYQDVNNVEGALREIGYDVVTVPVGDDIRGFLNEIDKISPMCIFNLCEDVLGNSWGEVYVAGLLELIGIPYTGSGPFSLAISLNKARAKDVLTANNIKVPSYKVFSKRDCVLPLKTGFPVIVKPLYEDGSIGIDCNSVVYGEEELIDRVSTVHEEFNEPAIVEEYIDGREINVSLIGNGEELRVLPISEIDYTTMPLDFPRICSYRAKWDSASIEYKNTVPVCPAKISPQLRDKIEDLSKRVYEIIGCRDYARIDIRLDKFENPYIIDVNPNPCLGLDSGFIRSAKEAGFSYQGVINEILNVCIERNGTGQACYTGIVSRG